MKLIITNSIREFEFSPIRKNFPLEAIKISAKKAIEGLGENIKSSRKIPFTILKKLYLTGISGAGRAIFLLQINKNVSVLVMIRMKNDKQIGTNMTVKNSKFEKLLNKYLDIIVEDIENGDYDEYVL